MYNAPDLIILIKTIKLIKLTNDSRIKRDEFIELILNKLYF